MIDTIASLLFNLLGLFAASVILWRAEPALNRMTRTTHWMIRYAMLLIAAGALALCVAIIAGTPPGMDTLLLALGIAMLMLCERRLRYLVNHKSGDRHA